MVIEESVTIGLEHLFLGRGFWWGRLQNLLEKHVVIQIGMISGDFFPDLINTQKGTTEFQLS
jgi:hypothetical protein